MKRLFITLIAVIALLLTTAGQSEADKGKGRNNPKPENPPCDANHGHPPCPDDDDGTDDGTGTNCTEAAGDPGILTDDTLGQTLWDGGLQVPPLTEDPEADGPLSGAIYDGGTGQPVEPITDEVACAVDLFLGPDLPDL